MSRRRSTRSEVMSAICTFREFFYYLLVLESMLLLLSLFSLLFIDLEGGPFVILVLDLALLVPLFLLTVFVIYKCRAR